MMRNALSLERTRLIAEILCRFGWNRYEVCPKNNMSGDIDTDNFLLKRRYAENARYLHAR
jgi:hypothetical protein